LLDWNACPRPAAGIEINPVVDGYIVYDPTRDRIHYLNHTAVLLLEFCDGRRKAGELPRLLQTTYDLPEAPVGEVEAFLEKLFEEGLVH
jgi:hypothetical protein